MAKFKLLFILFTLSFVVSQESWMENFESGTLDGWHVEGGNVSLSTNAYEGDYSLYLEHYAGQQPHNLYPEDLTVHYGDFSLAAATSGGISDLNIWMYQGDENEGERLWFGLRPNGSDNPGLNIEGFGVVESDSPDFNVGEWIVVDMHVEPGYVSLSVNGDIVLESNDLQDIPEGRFKLGVSFRGYYDNISYTPLVEETTAIHVPEDYATVQEAIDAAENGDEIQVAAGTYYVNNLNIDKDLTITGDDPSNTYLSGSGSHRIMTISSPGNSVLEISNFTITDGHALNNGGFVVGFVDNNDYSLVEFNNMIFENSGGNTGNTLFRGNGWETTTYKNCIVRYNNSENYAGIGNATVLGTQLYGNSGWNNTGVLVGCNSINCTVYSNSGGFMPNAWTVGGMSGGITTNSIFWGNEGHNGQQIYSAESVTFSDVQGGYDGVGNINQDPMFVNAGSGNFNLQNNSPCIGAGMDGVDMGYTGYSDSEQVFGCTDINACNYNIDATINDGSCEYPEDNDWCDCNGNVEDCAGECGGGAVIDECGECNGNNFPCSDDQLINEFYLDMTQNSTLESAVLDADQNYYLVISGTYCVGSCWPTENDLQDWNGHNRDAAFAYATYDDLPSPGGHWEWNGEFNIRPNPDEYNPDHIYNYPFVGNGGSEVFHFQDDGGYGDNSGGLTIQVWKQETTAIHVPEDYATVQEAIDAAENGDEIQVAAGTYYVNNLNIDKDLTITGDDPSNTYLSGSGSHRIMTISSPGNSVLEISNFTITDGHALNNGGFVVGFVDNNDYSLVEFNNMIFENSGGNTGNTLFRGNGWETTTYKNCIVRYNNSENYAGIGNATVLGTQLYGNSGWNNTGVLVGCNSINCTVYSNSGGFMPNAWTVGGMSGGITTNSIFWGNEGHNGQQIYSAESVTFSDVQGGYDGVGNINQDPMFVNAGSGNFNLQNNSPCIGAGMDGVDMGYTGYSDSEQVFGCTDINACNYNIDATINDGSCEYPEDNYDCDGNCIVDLDCNGDCGGGADFDECGECAGSNSTCSGCTDPLADNYDSDATIDDGSCDYPFDPCTSLQIFENAGVSSFSKSENAVYVLGSFEGSLELGDTELNSSDGGDVYLVKLSECDVEWALHLSGGSVGSGDLVVDYNGDILFAGTYYSSMTLYHTSGEEGIPHDQGGDGYIVKINSNGEHIWNTTLRGGSNEGMGSIAIDHNNNVYISGGFNGCCPSYMSATLHSSNGSSYTLFAESYANGFAAKLDSEGTPLWGINGWGRDLGMGALYVYEDELYITGGFRTWNSGDSGTITSMDGNQYSLYNPGIGLAFLAKYNTDGIHQWNTSIGNSGNGVNATTSISDILATESGDIIVSGSYSNGECTFYSTNGESISTQEANENDGFVAMYDNDGIPSWATAYSGSGYDGVSSLEIIDEDAILAGGAFSEELYYGEFVSNGENDIFISHIDTGGSVHHIETFGSNGNDALNDMQSSSQGLLFGGTISSGTMIDGNTAEVGGGFIYIPEAEGCVPGDTNYDDLINIIDIVNIVSFILGNSNPTEDEACAADYNGDGLIDVFDIIIMIGYILDN